MRRARAVVGAAALLAMLAACGDDGGSSEEVEDFCAGFENVADIELTDQQTAREMASRLQELDPPDEVADDYARVLDGVEALSEINITDQEEVERVEEHLTGAREALDAVLRFVDEEC